MVVAAEQARTRLGGNVAHGGAVSAAVGKHKPSALPRMRTTHADVVRIARSYAPPCRHGLRLHSVVKKRAVVGFVAMERRV